MQNAQELYRVALQHVADQYQNHPAAAQAWFLLAEWYRENDQVKGNARAVEILQRVLNSKEESIGRSNAQQLYETITQVRLAFKIENFMILNLSFYYY